jgi:glycolate oxidase iron-sulfur subunit
VQDVIYPEINRQTADILLRNGCEVVTPREQVCCGSLHGHNGDLETARKLARRNLDVFDLDNIDAIVVNAAGCGSFMRHYDHLLANDPEYLERARLWTSKVRDVLELLDEIGWTPPPATNGAPAVPATYHEACHLVHGQKVSAAPRRVLARVPGYEWRELPEATWCCGSAGIYNITHPHMARPLGERKVENIRSTGARVVVAANPGCMIQIEAEAETHGVDVEVVHPVTLIHRAYEFADRTPAD